MAANGRYVYCIMPDIGKGEWGAAGLNGERVYTIGWQDICALVHDCPTEPYQGDEVTVKGWVWTHGEVIDADYRRYFETVTACAEEVAVNKAKRPADGKQMLLNLSLLVRKENVSALGRVLDGIQAEEGIEVRFTGPWPPNSFVAKKAGPGQQ